MPLYSYWNHSACQKYQHYDNPEYKFNSVRQKCMLYCAEQCRQEIKKDEARPGTGQLNVLDGMHSAVLGLSEARKPVNHSFKIYNQHSFPHITVH